VQSVIQDVLYLGAFEELNAPLKFVSVRFAGKYSKKLNGNHCSSSDDLSAIIIIFICLNVTLFDRYK